MKKIEMRELTAEDIGMMLNRKSVRLNPKLDVFYVFHEHFPLIIRLIPVVPP